MSHKSNMNVDGESDDRVVPTKCPNKDGKPSAEGAEGRRSTKENSGADDRDPNTELGQRVERTAQSAGSSKEG